MYTHTLTKVGNSYLLKDIKNPNNLPVTFKDYQVVEQALRRRGCWETTQGTEILPKSLQSLNSQ